MADPQARSGLEKSSTIAAPRQRRSQERRRELARVAVQLIQERGFDALSVSEVAETAGISIGGMYRYIRTKTDLLVMACEDIFSGLRQEMLEAMRSEQGIPAKLETAMRVYWVACNERLSLLRLTYREYRSLPPEAQDTYKKQETDIADLFSDLIRAGMIADEFNEADDRIVAQQIIFMSHINAFKGWALREKSAEQLLAEHTQLFMARLRRTPLP